MKISVLINNYNYGHFLDRTLASVASQTRPADEVIVVDDGSTDDSVDIVRRWAAKDPRVRIIEQENQGQLSTFNAGFEASTGDVITFLDGDDEYLPGWLERLELEYSARPTVDYIFCPMIVVGDGAAQTGTQPWEEFDFGLTFLRALMLQAWVSSPTSGISARRRLLESFLPMPLIANCHNRANADLALAYGASVALGHKFQIGEPYVRYHLHGDNVFLGHRETSAERHIRRVTVYSMMQHLVGDAWQGHVWRQRLPSLIYREFATIPRPRFSDARIYSRMIRLSGGSKRWRRHVMIWSRWLWLKYQRSA